MFGTFLCPDTCGFAKVAALEIEEQVLNAAKENNKQTPGGKNTENSINQEQFRVFSANFNKDRYQINFTKYKTNLKKIKNHC